MSIVAGPKLLHGRHQFLHIGDTLLLRHTACHAVELVLISAAGDTKFEPPAGQVITKRGLACQPDRSPVRRNQRRRAKPYLIGVLRQPGKNRKGIGGYRAFDSVMLRCPQCFKATCVS